MDYYPIADAHLNDLDVIIFPGSILVMLAPPSVESALLPDQLMMADS